MYASPGSFSSGDYGTDRMYASPGSFSSGESNSPSQSLSNALPEMAPGSTESLPSPAPLAYSDPKSNSEIPKKDKTSGSAGYASATEEDKVVQESIPVPSQQSQFTHITKLIAEDLKKMPIEEIRTYPWNELGDKDVELVIKYLSYDPKFLGKILANTPEDGISKFQNSISLKTFNEIVANMPPDQVQLIKDKFS